MEDLEDERKRVDQVNSARLSARGHGGTGSGDSGGRRPVERGRRVRGRETGGAYTRAGDSPGRAASARGRPVLFGTRAGFGGSSAGAVPPGRQARGRSPGLFLNRGSGGNGRWEQDVCDAAASAARYSPGSLWPSIRRVKPCFQARRAVSGPAEPLRPAAPAPLLPLDYADRIDSPRKPFTLEKGTVPAGGFHVRARRNSF